MDPGPRTDGYLLGCFEAFASRISAACFARQGWFAAGLLRFCVFEGIELFQDALPSVRVLRMNREPRKWKLVFPAMIDQPARSFQPGWSRYAGIVEKFKIVASAFKVMLRRKIVVECQEAGQAVFLDALLERCHAAGNHPERRRRQLDPENVLWFPLVVKK